MWIINIILIFIAIYFTLKIATILGGKFLLLIYILFNFAQQITSIIYLNTGVFVNELNRTTYNIPKSTPLFILYTDIFLIMLYYFGKKYKKQSIMTNIIIKSTTLSKTFCYGTILLTLGLVLYTLADLAISGIPMFVDLITHYNYYSTYSTLPFASTINNWLTISMYLLGFAYVHIDKKIFRMSCIVLVIFAMGIRILMGFRMSGLIDIPLNFLAIVALISKEEFKNIRQILKPKYVILALGIIISVITIFIASTIFNGNAESVSVGFEVLINRAFGLGNHLWWAAEADNITGNDFFGHNLLKEIGAIFTGKSQYDVDTGIYYLMKKYGYSYIVNVDIKHGIRYAATFITTAVYNWGYFFAIIPITIIARVTIGFINSIEYALKRDNFIQLLLICKIWGTFSTFLIASGTMAEWLNIENYIYFIIYFALRYARKRTRFTIGRN